MIVRTAWILASALALAAPSPAAILKPGDMLVPFSLKNVDGKDYAVTLEEGRLTVTATATVDGRTETVKSHPAAVLIDFWATWCVPCRQSMPHMQRLHETYQPADGRTEGGLRLFGIAIDDAGGKVVRPFYQKLKITYPMLADPPSSAPGVAVTSAKDMKKSYGVQEIPVVFIIDASGTIVHAHMGFKEAHVAELDAVIKNLVAGAAR
jgi:thiol-disulfide isomerase/thioredoxin